MLSELRSLVVPGVLWGNRSDPVVGVIQTVDKQNNKIEERLRMIACEQEFYQSLRHRFSERLRTVPIASSS